MRISPREIEVTDIFENQGHKLKFSEEKWGGGGGNLVTLSL